MKFQDVHQTSYPNISATESASLKFGKDKTGCFKQDLSAYRIANVTVLCLSYKMFDKTLYSI